MIESVRNRVAVSDIALHFALAAGSVASFGWLLIQDQIHPLLIYCLQLFLSF